MQVLWRGWEKLEKFWLSSLKKRKQCSQPLPKVALEALLPRPFSLEALKRRVALEGFGLRFMERLKGRAG